MPTTTKMITPTILLTERDRKAAKKSSLQKRIDFKANPTVYMYKKKKHRKHIEANTIFCARWNWIWWCEWEGA